jgi:PKD repeat protein
MRRGIAVLVTGVLGGVGAIGASQTVSADSASGTFVYTGEAQDTATIFDTGLLYIDGCSQGDLAFEPNDPTLCFPDDFPGTAWFWITAGVRYKVVSAQTANFGLEAPDSFRQDTNAPFATTLDAVDASGKEIRIEATPYIRAAIAYDTPLANCPKNTITSVAQLLAASTSGSCLNAVGDTGEVDIASFDLLNADTTFPYAGQRVINETHSSPELDIGALVGLPGGLLGVRLDAIVTATLTVPPGGGYHAQRVIATSGGGDLVSGSVAWPSNGPVDDLVHVPCAAPVGDNLVYKLTENKWTGHGDVDVQPELVVTNPFSDIHIALGGPVNLFDVDMELTAAPDFTTVLGEIGADTKPPVIASVSAPAGNEGAPITFSADATDNCGTPSLRWDFSDGGVAFGPSPQHVFADNGVKSGQVTATDAAGNTAVKTFSVSVGNVDPVVAAGPDDGAAWGRTVAFNGAATDPGSADQSTLVYSWDFGDGTPSANGGPSTTHAYAAPGNYTATLTVCDKNGGCSEDDRLITVRKRSVSVGQLGAANGTYDTAGTLSASLIDEFGTPVGNRSIVFDVGGQAAGSAATNGSGIATRAFTPLLGEGSHLSTATFSADALYFDAAASEDFDVSVKATSLTYTGATTGGPNKTVTLSAKLVDATGKPLAGRSIGFQLGAQATSATTSASGVATVQLKLTQKNGTYPLTAGFVPAGADLDHYSGSGVSVTFKLQAK